MTRRSPPSQLSLLPPHLPTPPRGAPKFSLPSLPQAVPTTTHRRRRSVSSVSSLDEILLPVSMSKIPLNTHQPQSQSSIVQSRYAEGTEVYRPAEEGSKPPWVRSRGFDVADAELGWGKGVKLPKGVMVSDRE
ncbi:hypothetical protein I316_05271 [Kwoniella heveanensis BCC8398]|uniref:Uncharacterized protein n=1 Tax=Kwoniella heveanensis BCC8398 TaxID=1296120 RepID=A0A1B9GP96_9TREE|nr:hypothetical protein I316_05271 [Kwoniella heveanensis BCC8398]